MNRVAYGVAHPEYVVTATAFTIRGIVKAVAVKLKPRPNNEKAWIRATGVRTATAKKPFQVDTLLHCPIKVEGCLSSRLLHRKREVAL